MVPCRVRKWFFGLILIPAVLLPPLDVARGAPSGPGSPGAEPEAVAARTQAQGATITSRPQRGPRPRIAIATPRQNARVTLSRSGLMRISGRVRSETALRRVRISSGTRNLGVAKLQRRRGVTDWSLRTSAPLGRQRIVATAVDRRGRTASDARRFVVEAPPRVRSALSNRSHVLTSAEADRIAHVSKNAITLTGNPDVQPNEILISGVTDQTPNGLLRRVVAVEEGRDKTIAVTEPASLTDVFQQADISLRDVPCRPPSLRRSPLPRPPLPSSPLRRSLRR